MIWTDQHTTNLKRLWPKKELTCEVIANQLGVSKGTVIGRASRLKLGPKPSVGRGSTWSAEENDRLRQLWPLDNTAEEIGKVIGKTRDAVISRAQKMELGVKPSLSKARRAELQLPHSRNFFTEAEDQRLRSACAGRADDGYIPTKAELGAELDRSVDAIAKRLRTLKLVLKPTRPADSNPLSTWSPAREQRLKELVADGTRWVDIGVEFDLKPSLARAKAQRMGLQIPKRRIGPPTKAAAPTLSEAEKAEAETQRRPVAIAPDHLPRITELGSHDCKWPIGDQPSGAEQRFCGERAVPGARQPYCLKHGYLNLNPALRAAA